MHNFKLNFKSISYVWTLMDHCWIEVHFLHSLQLEKDLEFDDVLDYGKLIGNIFLNRIIMLLL